MTTPTVEPISVLGATPVPKRASYAIGLRGLATAALDNGTVLQAAMLYGDGGTFGTTAEVGLEIFSGDDLSIRSASTVPVAGLVRGTPSPDPNALETERHQEIGLLTLYLVSATHAIITLEYERRSRDANGFSQIAHTSRHQAVLQIAGTTVTLAVPFETVSGPAPRYLRRPAGALRIDGAGLRLLDAPQTSLAAGEQLRSDVRLDNVLAQNGAVLLLGPASTPATVDLRSNSLAPIALQLDHGVENPAVLSPTAIAWITIDGRLHLVDGGEYSLLLDRGAGGQIDYTLTPVTATEVAVIERHIRNYSPGYRPDDPAHVGINPDGPLAEQWSHSYVWRIGCFAVVAGVVTQTRAWTPLAKGLFQEGETS